jgi:hypothetical protein
MSERQNEQSLDRSTVTECNPCKLTFDVSPADVREARTAGDQDKSNKAVNDLPKVEIVAGPSEKQLSEDVYNGRNLGQPRDICKNPDAGDWAPVKCDADVAESKQMPNDKTLSQSEMNQSGDVRDICKNPDAGDWAPAKCDTSAKQPRDMSEEQLLSLPVDVALKHKEDEYKQQYYRQKRSDRREELRSYDSERLTAGL